jgi:hypothetical protein
MPHVSHSPPCCPHLTVRRIVVRGCRADGRARLSGAESCAVYQEAQPKGRLKIRRLIARPSPCYARYHGMSVPFGERGGALRGVVDLACGRLPRFVFGGGVGPLLPVFHFHSEPRFDLEPKLRYLQENGYRTVSADELAGVATGERRPGSREVALCFDDAWATVWTDAAPLLQAFGQTAIVYAIPGRIGEADRCRPDRAPHSGLVEASSPFMTWPELRALASAGTIDVQSHTWSHAMVFTSMDVIDFVGPEYARTPLLNRPMLIATDELQVVEPTDLGAPLYEQRSRMSDARRREATMDAHRACLETVRQAGGLAFFRRPDWRATLQSVAAKSRGRERVESDTEHREAIEAELDRSRSELNARLRTNRVRHVCLPWGVSGATTSAALTRLGFVSAVANRWRGVFAVRPGDHPFWLKRLPNRYIFSLPGHGRRAWLTLGRLSGTPQ